MHRRGPGLHVANDYRACSLRWPALSFGVVAAEVGRRESDRRRDDRPREQNGASRKRRCQTCAYLPELRPYLEEAWDHSEGQVYVVEGYRSSAANLRTRFTAIIKRAGLAPWPKLFQNLRASRETELMMTFPAKDVASWIGNSVAVAMESYAMALEQSFANAKTRLTAVSGSTGGSNDDEQTPSAAITTPQKISNSSDTARQSSKRGTVRVATHLVREAGMGDTELESVTSAV